MSYEYAKWYPDMIDKVNDEKVKNKKTLVQEWGKVLSQVTTYMADNDCRYGFIITDAHLVVLRLACIDTNAADREYANPEYCDIPWGGEDKEDSGAEPGLTPKLALFFWYLLASCNRRTQIASKYPNMNCWHKWDHPRKYINTYTGREKKELDAGDEVEGLSEDELQITETMKKLTLQKPHKNKQQNS